MSNDVYVTIEKKSAYGWSLATTPIPMRCWPFLIPASDLDAVLEKVVQHFEQAPQISALPPARDYDFSHPADVEEFQNYLDGNISTFDGAVLFGDESWFLWLPGTPEIFEQYSPRLFSVLAGIENTFGLQPIAPPRGLPGDACPETMAYYQNHYNPQDASFVTLAELQNYSWVKFASLHNLGLAKPTAIGVTQVEDILKFLKNVGDPDDVRMVFWFTR